MLRSSGRVGSTTQKVAETAADQALAVRKKKIEKYLRQIQATYDAGIVSESTIIPGNRLKFQNTFLLAANADRSSHPREEGEEEGSSVINSIEDAKPVLASVRSSGSSLDDALFRTGVLQSKTIAESAMLNALKGKQRPYDEYPPVNRNSDPGNVW